MTDHPARAGAILIVDDEPDTLSTLKELLEQRLDVQVVTAASPVEALEALKSRAVHMIVSDYRMPRMNGAEFLAAARRIYPGVHIVLMTGYGQTLPEDGAALNVDAFMAKPFQASQIIGMVRETLEIAT